MKYIIILSILLITSNELIAQRTEFSTETDVHAYLMQAGRFKNKVSKISITFSGYLAEHMEMNEISFLQPTVILTSSSKAIIKCISKNGDKVLIFVVDADNDMLIERSTGITYTKVGLAYDEEELEEDRKKHENDSFLDDPKYQTKIDLSEYFKINNLQIPIGKQDDQCQILFYNNTSENFKIKSNIFKGYVKNKKLFDLNNIYIGDLDENEFFYFLVYKSNDYYEYDENSKSYINKAITKKIYGKKKDDYVFAISMRARRIGFYDIENDSPVDPYKSNYFVSTNSPQFCMINAFGTLFSESVYSSKENTSLLKGKYLYKKIIVPVIDIK